MKKYWMIALFMVCAASVATNIFLGWRVFRSEPRVADASITYPFLSKRIFIENQNDLLINFYPLRKQIRAVTVPWGDTFAMYFEYLPTGTSIGINEKIDFYSASLLKLPMAMAYFYQREKNGLEVENNNILIEEKHVDRGFGQLWKQGAGVTIPVDEVLRLSLTQSDNTAANALASHIHKQNFFEVYEGLDINFVQDSDSKVLIGAKSYASILKSLYFASIINREHSNMILTLLTTTAFEDKLVNSIPAEIPVAHKIGVHEGSTYQDCGIVYVPKRPYALCMMSKSTDEEATKRMQEVSHIIFTFVQSQHH